MTFWERNNYWDRKQRLITNGHEKHFPVLEMLHIETVVLFM